MNVKEHNVMSSKPEWFYNQSGVVPVLNGRVVLITARKSKRWTIPKGIVEKDMSPHDSAAKEAYEEAGVVGNVRKKELGRYDYPKWGGTCTVRVYPFYVEELLDRWEEMHVRKRRIVSLSKAIEMIDNDALAEILQAFFNRLEKK
ncbi:NUDIX hydrolase [Prosthecochloris sp. SCSIO W1101]|uniref:NUDIX hydrolase n=1 Tax=Prosthecochloris sp. SCSIO W1101 TaxID=2992242 RepID=UPI00223E4353|nr:NUDIX hydrolase [Prosthecochloris sp. SCSIO W1101]UZJ42283.1 NUDIX hydrolase [Prosthecochloris sp. SCSIO W1101]